MFKTENKNLQEFDYAGEVRSINEKLGVEGKRSYIYETENELEIGIEAPNHVVSITNLEKEGVLESVEENDFELFITGSYLTALEYFSIAEELEEDWAKEYSASQAESIINEDINSLRNKIVKYENSLK